MSTLRWDPSMSHYGPWNDQPDIGITSYAPPGRLPPEWEIGWDEDGVLWAEPPYVGDCIRLADNVEIPEGCEDDEVAKRSAAKLACDRWFTYHRKPQSYVVMRAYYMANTHFPSVHTLFDWQKQAYEENAPMDAILRQGDGKYMTLRDLSEPEKKKILRNVHLVYKGLL